MSFHGAAPVRRPASAAGYRGPTPLQRAIAATGAFLAFRTSPDSYDIPWVREGFVPTKSVAVAYRRSVFDVVGLFDENFALVKTWNSTFAWTRLDCGVISPVMWR